ERSGIFSAAWRSEGVPRMCPRLRAVPGLSTETQSHLSWRWMPDPPFALCARPSGRGHDLAAPVHDVSCRVHGPPALRLALSPDATRRGSRRPASATWRSQSGMVCGDLPPLADGGLSLGLCVRPPQSRDGLDPVRATTARLFPGGGEA